MSSGIGEGDAYFVNSEGKATHRFDLQGIGDPAIFSRGQLSDMIDQLKGFLNSKGMALPSGGIAEIFSGFLKKKLQNNSSVLKIKDLEWLEFGQKDAAIKPAVYTAKKSLRF